LFSFQTSETSNESVCTVFYVVIRSSTAYYYSYSSDEWSPFSITNVLFRWVWLLIWHHNFKLAAMTSSHAE